MRPPQDQQLAARTHPPRERRLAQPAARAKRPREQGCSEETRMKLTQPWRRVSLSLSHRAVSRSLSHAAVHTSAMTPGYTPKPKQLAPSPHHALDTTWGHTLHFPHSSPHTLPPPGLNVTCTTAAARRAAASSFALSSSLSRCECSSSSSRASPARCSSDCLSEATTLLRRSVANCCCVRSPAAFASLRDALRTATSPSTTSMALNCKHGKRAKRVGHARSNRHRCQDGSRTRATAMGGTRHAPTTRSLLSAKPTGWPMP